MRFAMLKALRTLPILLAAGCAEGPRGGAVASPSIAIVGVTVIDMTGAPPRPGMTVVVTGPRITAVGAASEVRIPAGARRIEGAGRYLVPGLWDAHAHVSLAGEESLPVFVAAGVTSVRDLGGSYAGIRGWSRAIQAGERIGPRIRTAGPVLESGAFLDRVARIDRMLAEEHGVPLPGPAERAFERVRVVSPQNARRAVDSLRTLGVDLVKSRTFESRESFFAIAAAARGAGLPLAVHYPYHGIPLAEVSDAVGSGSVEHAFQYADALDSLSADERTGVYERLVRNGTWLVPTLHAEYMRTIADSAAERVILALFSGADARGRSLTPTLRERWERDWRIRVLEHRLQPPVGAEDEFLRNVVLLREMHRAGVRMLVGTDVGALSMLPGYGVHDELAILVERVGMTPMQALQAATRNPAAFFGMQDSLGTIAPGMLADLVLLDADPLRDIRNTTAIHAVLMNGRLLDRQTLDRLASPAR
jgi:hypothetical protein